LLNSRQKYALQYSYLAKHGTAHKNKSFEIKERPIPVMVLAKLPLPVT
jgi:hypothetical protein